MNSLKYSLINSYGLNTKNKIGNTKIKNRKRLILKMLAVFFMPNTQKGYFSLYIYIYPFFEKATKNVFKR